MLRSVQADSHLQMLCRRGEGRRTGLAASVENWAGILDRDRRAIKSGQAKPTATAQQIVEVNRPKESSIYFQGTNDHGRVGIVPRRLL